MSLIEAGIVTSVDSRSIGSSVVELVPAGSDVLFVDDNVDFSPGDQVLISTDGEEGEQYTITAVDAETGLTISPPLAEDAVEGTWVAVYPLQYETVAMVRMVESGEVLPCIVVHTLSDALRDGIRDEDTSETVLTVAVDDQRYVFDVVARQTVRDIAEALPGVPPAKAATPVLSTMAYLDSMKNLRAQVTASWSPVTTNEDGTDITDLDRYEVQTKGATGGWQTYTSTPGDITQAFIRDLAPGSSWSVRVRAVDTSKNAGEWSDPAAIDAATDDIAPEQPSRPTVTSRLGNLTITWDGKTSTGTGMADDLAFVEVHLSTTSGFTPSAATKVDQLPGSASVVWGPAAYGTTYYVRLVAVDTSGNVSAPSLQQASLVAPLVDVSNFPDDAMQVLYARTGHFIELDADQIRANSIASDFLETGTVIGGIFQASDGGEFRTNANPTNGGIRIRDADGFKAWAAGGGTPTVEIDRTTGIITARGGNFPGGSVTAGTFSTASAGARMVIENDLSGGIIKFFSGVSGEGPGYLNPGTGGAGQPAVTLGSGTSMVPANATIRLVSAAPGIQPQVQMAGNASVTGRLDVSGTTRVVGDLDLDGLTSSLNANNGSVTGKELYSLSDTGTGAADAEFGAAGRVKRKSSTRRVKEDIEPMPLDVARRVLDAEEATFRYRDRDTYGDRRYAGGIAEQFADAGLDLWVTRDAAGEPDGIRYAELTVPLIAIVRDLDARLTALERP